ncbi:hypothetical protein [Alkalihalobacterium elongatum]|uniref:hypothetical protein n=1 Tax=Alkalihalobacterium elongatum TaxID=2675466 RepID=UPI001C1FD4F3|nr:hypothetical protein [Alkalihalobacterium elongatum]
MDKEKQGSKNMPDFDKLSDRMIAEPTDSPTFVMKTNLDPKNVTEDNPYFNEKNKQQSEEFCDYFEEE